MRVPSSWLPRAGRSVVLVIDMQERLAAAMPSEESCGAVRNSGILVQAAVELNLPVIVSEQYPKGLGPSVAAVRAALPECVQPVEKLAFSCCDHPGLQFQFEALADYDFILCGIEAHVCVLQTALDLLAQGRRVFVAADAVCSRTALNRQLGLDIMQRAGAIIGSTEIFVFGWIQTAGTDTFKRISKLVK